MTSAIAPEPISAGYVLGHASWIGAVFGLLGGLTIAILGGSNIGAALIVVVGCVVLGTLSAAMSAALQLLLRRLFQRRPQNLGLLAVFSLVGAIVGVALIYLVVLSRQDAVNPFFFVGIWALASALLIFLVTVRRGSRRKRI